MNVPSVVIAFNLTLSGNVVVIGIILIRLSVFGSGGENFCDNAKPSLDEF